jgi:hypothetical protein
MTPVLARWTTPAAAMQAITQDTMVTMATTTSVNA